MCVIPTQEALSSWEGREEKVLGSGDVTQLLAVERLPTGQEAPDLILERFKPGVVTHGWNPSTWGVEEGGSGVQGHPQVHTEFEAILESMGPVSRK